MARGGRGHAPPGPLQRPGHLEETLRSLPPTMSRLFCMDGVNSMTGNVPDLSAYARICREYDALLYVDDAHGFGVIGESPTPSGPYGRRGNSIVRYFDESYDNVVLVGGFSKSYSSLLAFMALPTALKNHLKVAAAPYLYSGPSPTASLATVLAGFRVNDAEGDDTPGLAWPRRRPACSTGSTELGLLHAQHVGAADHRAAARPGRRHRRRRPVPLRPGDLRHAGRVPPGAEVPGGFPDPDSRRPTPTRRSTSSTTCWASSPSASTCSGGRLPA